MTFRTFDSTNEPHASLHMNKGHFAIGILVAGITFGAYWIGHSGAPPPSAKVNTSSGADSSEFGQGSRAEAAVVGLERRLELMEARQALAGTASSAVGIAPGASSQGAQEQPPEVDEAEQKTREESQQAAIEKRFATETRDRSWAASTEDEIRRVVASFSGEAGGNGISSLSCLTTICRLEMPIADNAGPGGPTSDTVLGTQVTSMKAFQVKRTRDDATGKNAIIYTFFRNGLPEPE